MKKLMALVFVYVSLFSGVVHSADLEISMPGYSDEQCSSRKQSLGIAPTARVIDSNVEYRNGFTVNMRGEKTVNLVIQLDIPSGDGVVGSKSCLVGLKSLPHSWSEDGVIIDSIEIVDLDSLVFLVKSTISGKEVASLGSLVAKFRIDDIGRERTLRVNEPLSYTGSVEVISDSNIYGDLHLAVSNISPEFGGLNEAVCYGNVHQVISCTQYENGEPVYTRRYRSDRQPGYTPYAIMHESYSKNHPKSKMCKRYIYKELSSSGGFVTYEKTCKSNRRIEPQEVTLEIGKY